MPQFSDSAKITEYAAGALSKWARVKYTGDHIVDLAGLADRGVGVVAAPAFAANDPVPVWLFNKSGTFKAIASAAMNANDDVYTAAAGKVGPAATGGFLLGKARTKTTGANQIIEVVPIEAVGAAAP
jgi:hypothetical protein